MGPRMALMTTDAKRSELVERAGALARAAAPGLVPAGLALAAIGLMRGSYSMIVAGMLLATFALIGATSPRGP